MVDSRLSYYPSSPSPDEEQLRFAAELSRPREDFFDAFGKIAIGAVMTGGVLEPAPANLETRQATKELSVTAKDTLTRQALASTITLRTHSVDQALSWQQSREAALLN